MTTWQEAVQQLRSGIKPDASGPADSTADSGTAAPPAEPRRTRRGLTQSLQTLRDLGVLPQDDTEAQKD